MRRFVWQALGVVPREATIEVSLRWMRVWRKSAEYHEVRRTLQQNVEGLKNKYAPSP